ncbi:hypothetical protein REPUB_Repub11eG0015400 [Reevesia pubescens]
MPKSKAKLPLFGLNLAVFALFLILFPCACLARTTIQNLDCGSAVCGNVNISYPFRLKTQPRNCGCHSLELECENNNRTTLVMKYGNFSVKEINYGSYTMRLVDAGIDNDDCSSLHLSSILYSDFCCGFPYTTYPYSYSYPHPYVYLVNCTTTMKSSLYVDASRCANSSSRPSSYFYFLDSETPPSDFNQSCTVEAEVPIVVDYNTIAGMSTVDIYKELSMGFELSWEYYKSSCDFKSKISFQDMLASLVYGLYRYIDSLVDFLFYGPQLAHNAYYGSKWTYILCNAVTGGVILARTLSGIFLLIALVTYKWRRRHLSADDTIEEFLQRQNDLMPIRYSYPEIKRMTRGFKDKLGEGGYGSVFKGKLRSGYLVAIKLLGKSNANGQDFINEVATIGRIHHVNVAKLVGFCSEGSKQALVYDFMPNGSLDRIIFAKENKITLSWQKMFDIALGVARGIDYLHQGCDMQILHFDIKPHNILLDENFIPKVADFGLAKLCSVDDSIVSLTAARGTIGYIAPELIYKNLGGISYKADVYSFGMLLMEMVGRRKNMNAFVEQISQIYFPSWIYDRYYQGEDIELEDVTDEEKMIVRKMVITAFWCIQMKPNDRPSMSKVLKMFETDVELLQMPPRPFQLPFEISSENQAHENPTAETSTTLDSSNKISLNV